tara:strand:+ start:501 stop:680 length:180 start_codon:yes stop_codon:yes gene_type:complete
MEDRMRIGTIVKVNEQHENAGDTGVVVYVTKESVNVYWSKSDLTYWIDTKYLDVIYEQN